jgi:hypothetical protein
MSDPDAPSEEEKGRQGHPTSPGAHTQKSHSSPKSLPPGRQEDDYEVEEVDDLVTADAR